MIEMYARKAFYTKIINEEKKVLACITHVKYNLRNNTVSTSCSFTYDGNSVRIGLFQGIHHNSLLLNNKRDNEIRERIRELISKNPSISSNKLMTETGYCGNKLNQIYMSVKRQIHKENNRKTLQ